MIRTHEYVIADMLGQIKNKIILSSKDIEKWSSYSGWHKTAGRITIDDDSECIMWLGDRWKTGYDHTRFFKSAVMTPDKMHGKKMYLQIDFGGEALVRINQRIVGAVSSTMNSGWVGRTDIFLDTGVSGKVFDIEVEATVNSAGFCDEAIAGARETVYTMQTARLVAVDEATESYWYDLQTAFEALDYLNDPVIREKVYGAINKSIHIVDFDISDDAFYESIPAAAEEFWRLMGEINYTPQGEVIMSGHSHLDVAWLWTTRELVRKTARTFSNNIALMDRYPDFRFTQSQAIVYDYMKKHYPDIFEQIKEKVRKGQWEIVGNAWVEADTNIASGESLIRQLLFGREFFKREFGVTSDIYWLPDCFGFSSALPQIIKGSGMKYFYTSKISTNDTNRFPYSVFNWRSHSGDSVVAHLLHNSYQSEGDAKYIAKSWNECRQKEITGRAHGDFGYGDGGGGCTYNMLERTQRLAKMPGLPAVKNEFVSEFFRDLDKKSGDLPTWDGEIYYENHRGTYTSQAFVKKNNRQGEFLFRNAEAMSLIANALAKAPYPVTELEKGWKLLLTNQFHDILPGTSIHEVFDDCRFDYIEMHHIGDEIISSAASKLNGMINIEDESVVVWNMLTHRNTGEVSVPIEYEEVIVKSDKGEIVPNTIAKGGETNTLTFIAQDVPPMGYSVFKIKQGSVGLDIVMAGVTMLENRKIKVRLNSDGLMTSIYDKQNQREVLAGKGNLLTVFQDKCKHESAWNLEQSYQNKFWDLTKAQKIEVIESSPVKGVVRVVRTFNQSTITQDIILKADSDVVDISTTVDWYEKDKVLKAAFPVNVRSSFASYEVAHGALERPTHWNTSFDSTRFEVSAHKWADLSEGDWGVSILNDCKYGYDIKDNVMRITLMRSPGCPDPTADEGVNEFVYSIYPHKGSWHTADTVKNAFSLNVPMKGYVLGTQSGNLSDSFSAVSIDREDIIIDAFKQAQNGDGMILRVYESCGCRGRAYVNINLPFSRVNECNMMEIDGEKVQCDSDGFSFDIEPYQVKTFRIL